MVTKPDPLPIFLSLKQAAGILGMTYNGLCIWIRDGKGPPIYNFGARFKRVRRDELLSWFETKKRTPQHVQSDNRLAR